MNNYENEIFGFGNENVDEVEQPSNDFNYNSISGLGESNYENDDLFRTETASNNDNNLENDNNFNYGVEDYNNQYQENVTDNETNIEYEDNVFDESVSNYTEDTNTYEDIVPIVETTDDVQSLEKDSDIMLEEIPVEVPVDNQEEKLETKMPVEESNEPVIEMSETPIEELQSLTNFKEDNIEKMDINALFDKVSVNVKGASEIFKRNTEMKEKIDTRFEELKKLQSEVENSKKNQIDEINAYKDEVFSKLTEKKEEIEKRLNTLKDLQASLEKEKTEFEEYKKTEQEKIERVQKDVQASYDDRREELSHIEDTLRKQKDALDEERNQLSLDKIQYEADKNELANNILKFNELVDSFTNGVNGVTE